jgi:hypothetical protein
MKSKQLNENPSFDDIVKWLNENLSDKDSLIPHENPIPPIGSKGIYFWFMHPEGYEKLSRYADIKPIYPKFSKTIDGIEFDLVYVGTTGTGKQGKSNLNGRLNWHINDKHREKTICQKNSALSTFRTGIGSLLADDLIIPNTERTLNEFMSKYFRVFWINYPDDKKLIDRNEEVIIDRFKPIFNLKKNPNSYSGALENPTRVYKKRRNEVESNTKQRLGFTKNDSKKKLKMSQKSNSIKNVVNGELRNCVEFKVRRSQNIAEVADSIMELPTGPCTIELFYENEYDVRTYINAITRRVRAKDRKVSDYFMAPDTQNGNIPKYQMVHDEMNDFKNPIETITVLVCGKK